MLKPRLATLDTRRTKTTTADLSGTPRMRGRSWMTKRARWMNDHPLCCMCESEGRTEVATDLDHVVPLCNGGADDESNYQSLCSAHHKAKSAGEAKTRVWR